MPTVSYFQDVLTFRLVLKPDRIRLTPGFPDEAAILAGMTLINEEHEELADALAKADLPEVADAIGDLIYVLLSFAIDLGINLDHVWDEIQKANISKAGGPIRADGKLGKPPGFKPPNIAEVLRTQKTLIPKADLDFWVDEYHAKRRLACES